MTRDNSPQSPCTAVLHRMVMDKHVCPYGVKSKWLLERHGYTVDDRWLTTREQTDAFKREHGVETTPQTFIGGERIGGYTELRKFFGRPLPEVGHSTVPKPSTAPCMLWTSRSHQPVTSSSPTTTIIAPPSRITSSWWRRMTANARTIRR